jgi:hypothetical protein
LGRMYCVPGMDDASIQDLAMPPLREAVARGLVLVEHGAIELAPQSPVPSLCLGIAGMILLLVRTYMPSSVPANRGDPLRGWKLASIAQLKVNVSLHS